MITTEVKYKKTGNEWVSEIPANWDFRRLKNFAEIGSGQDQKRIENDNGKYSIYGTGGLMGKTNEFLYEGPSVILGRKGTIDNPFYVTEPFWTVDTAYYTKIKQNVDPRFFFYCCLTIRFDYYKYGSAVPSMSQRDLNQIRLPYPPLDEQKIIADYLDEQSNKINNFIQTKQRFIELLKEQRQSIITNAVTKGIYENAKMKKTVLGEIPEHWEVRRLATIGRFSKGGNISRSELIYSEEGIPAILYGDIYTKYDIVAENIINKISKETASKSVELKKGDLLFTGSGETKEDIGKCVVFNSNEPAYAGGDVIIFKQNIFDSYFISYSQNSSVAKHQKAISSKGEIIVHTYGSKLRDVIMPYPPTIEEQKQIVEHIKTETKTLDIAINKAEREIELMKEYREALIAEAVTGKRK